MLTVGSLFAGIGGFDLGLERAGMRVAWQSEIDPYASAVLRKHWPSVPNHGDIRSIRAGAVESVDVICGGFPCQPFSHAGKRGGESDDRYLWPEMLRVIDELRPAYVIGENVAGIISMALDQVLSDLEAIGYTTRPIVIPAVAVDAPHRRDRVWIIALRDRDRNREPACAVDAEVAGLCDVADAGCGRCGSSEDGQVEQSRRAEAVCTSAVAHAVLDGRQRQRDRRDPGSTAGDDEGREIVGAGCAASKWLPEPDVGRVANGGPSRVDRLRCLGNAIVPQIAEILGRAIIDAEMRAAA